MTAQSTDVPAQVGGLRIDAAGPAALAGELDPYQRWAALTEGAYLPCGTAGQLHVLRCRGPSTVGSLRAAAVSPAGWWIPPAYPSGAQHCTLRVTDAEAAAPTLQAWAAHALLLQADAGMARPDQARIPLPALRQAADSRRHAVDPARTVVAVIDSACGFAHRQFCSATDGVPTTRLAAYWDQGTDAAPPWAVPERFGYGRQLRRGAINRLLNRHLPASPVDDATRRRAEAALYDVIGHRLPEDSDWRHGCHMLDLASRLDPGGGDPLAAAALVHVQLPDWALNDTSARWAGVFVLDALRYVIDVARNAAEIVVNLSLGAFAGPHDGSSLLEQAIDALIAEQVPRLHVVVAAGNAGLPRDDGTRRVRPCHARVALAPAHQDGDRCELAFEVDLPDGAETFVELWLPQQGRPAEAAGLALCVRPPGQVAVLDAPPDHSATLRDQDRVVAALVNLTGPRAAAPALGDGGMALLALGSTRNLLGWHAPTGRWTLSLQNLEPQPMVADLWLQRRDVPGDLPGNRAQYGFVDLPGRRPDGPGAWWSARGTLGSLANGRHTVVVAAVERNAGGTAWQHAPYSSAAQADEAWDQAKRRAPLERTSVRAAPNVSLPGTAVAAGYWSGSSKSLQGTSVAAAQLTGRLAREAASCTGMGTAALLQRLPVAPEAERPQPDPPALGDAVIA